MTQIASAAKMDAKVALMICNTLAKTVLESNIYVISVTEIFRTILIKFTRDDNLAAAIVKLVK